MSEYLEYRTIIEMQLKFEPGIYFYFLWRGRLGEDLSQSFTFSAPFPAATVCNLNPFKYSELRQHQSIQETVKTLKHFIQS